MGDTGTRTLQPGVPVCVSVCLLNSSGINVTCGARTAYTKRRSLRLMILSNLLQEEAQMSEFCGVGGAAEGGGRGQRQPPPVSGESQVYKASQDYTPTS